MPGGFTAHSGEIKPPLPPVGLIECFAAAKRRIYLTATLADDSVLVTHFDAQPAAAEHPITPTSAADVGDRLILAPQEINPALREPDIRQAVRVLADEVNVVVPVPSGRRASEWAPLADIVTAADGIEAAVDRLQSGEHAGLVVLVNRYDGIDLPDDACRVLVIDGAAGGLRRDRPAGSPAPRGKRCHGQPPGAAASSRAWATVSAAPKTTAPCCCSARS